MTDSTFLAPPAVRLSDALRRSMARQNLGLREVLRTFNDPEQEYRMWEPRGPLAALEQDKVHVRERTIAGRRISLLCRWDSDAEVWEIAHSATAMTSH